MLSVVALSAIAEILFGGALGTKGEVWVNYCIQKCLCSPSSKV